MRKSILLFVLFALLNIPLMLFAQSGYKVKGHVVSAEDNEPMVGVSILEKKPMNFVGSIITSLRINPQHTIGQMYNRICRYQQMTDIPHVWIYIINRFLDRRGFQSYSGVQAHKKGYNKYFTYNIYHKSIVTCVLKSVTIEKQISWNNLLLCISTPMRPE